MTKKNTRKRSLQSLLSCNIHGFQSSISLNCARSPSGKNAPKKKSKNIQSKNIEQTSNNKTKKNILKKNVAKSKEKLEYKGKPVSKVSDLKPLSPKLSKKNNNPRTDSSSDKYDLFFHIKQINPTWKEIGRYVSRHISELEYHRFSLKSFLALSYSKEKSNRNTVRQKHGIDRAKHKINHHLEEISKSLSTLFPEKPSPNSEHCSACLSNTDVEGNEMIACDHALCGFSFHRNCCIPIVSQKEFDYLPDESQSSSDDQSLKAWFCRKCDIYFFLLNFLNEKLGTEYDHYSEILNEREEVENSKKSSETFIEESKTTSLHQRSPKYNTRRKKIDFLSLHENESEDFNLYADHLNSEETDEEFIPSPSSRANTGTNEEAMLREQAPYNTKTASVKCTEVTTDSVSPSEQNSQSLREESDCSDFRSQQSIQSMDEETDDLEFSMQQNSKAANEDAQDQDLESHQSLKSTNEGTHSMSGSNFVTNKSSATCLNSQDSDFTEG
eukprot:snap_masked-scaffold_41-processed-gene-2.62-mRNA-1 protein AED:0.10 eAED:1.00 QI:0/-1/0/1/-1/1/1/0/497